MVKFFLSCLLLFVTLSGQQCAGNLEQEALFQKWTHLHENDKDGIEEYRTNAFDFPLSRGRTGFEFKKDGTFIQYDIAPTDGNVAVPGTWKKGDAENSIQIQLQNPEKTSYQLQITELSQDILKIKKIKVN